MQLLSLVLLGPRSPAEDEAGPLKLCSSVTAPSPTSGVQYLQNYSFHLNWINKTASWHGQQ